MKPIEELAGTGIGKLWIADFDGNIAIDGKILAENIEVIKKIIESGAEFVSASARSIPDLISRFKDSLGEYINDKIHFSSHNGSFAIYKGEPISDNKLNENILKEILGDKPETKEVVMFDYKDAYCFNPNTKTLNWYSKNVIEREIKKINQIPDNIYIVEFPLYKKEDKVELAQYDINSQEFKPPFSNIIGPNKWQQISSNSDKENLIEAYAKVIGIKNYKDIITSGDGPNDARMINNPKVRGIMMGNGNMNLENAYKTKKVDEGGFAYAFNILKNGSN